MDQIHNLEPSSHDTGGLSEHDRGDLTRLLREQAALRQVATLVAHGGSPDVVFDAVVEQLGGVLGADGVKMLRRETDGTVTMIASWGVPAHTTGTPVGLEGANVTSEVLRTGRTAWVEDFSGPDGSLGWIAARQGVKMSVGAPIIVDGDLWGVMAAIWVHERPRPAEAEERLAQFTDLTATAIANMQAREDLLASRIRLVTAGDRARHRIERDLHDGTQQQLISLGLELRDAEEHVPDSVPELRTRLAGISDRLTTALDDLCELARGIHPAILSEGGLAPALKALARRSAIPVDLGVRVTTRLSPAVEIAAYYVTAEALTNATKYAKASLVRIEADDTTGRLVLTISDDGVGGANLARGSGLVGLTDRVEALGGRIAIVSPRGRGTSVRVQLPTES